MDAHRRVPPQIWHGRVHGRGEHAAGVRTAGAQSPRARARRRDGGAAAGVRRRRLVHLLQRGGAWGGRATPGAL
eukprot:7380332-Prymnesium_polylepis.1